MSQGQESAAASHKTTKEEIAGGTVAGVFSLFLLVLGIWNRRKKLRNSPTRKAVNVPAASGTRMNLLSIIDRDNSEVHMSDISDNGISSES